MENQRDWFVTVLTNRYTLETFWWYHGMDLENPIEYLENNWSYFFTNKIIIEINDGENIIYKICRQCLTDLEQDNDWLCPNCNI